MSISELALKQVLDDHSHLDLTSDMVKNGTAQVGGGGFSDVFRSKMRRGWQPRPDPYILSLLDLDPIDYSISGPTKRRRISKKSTGNSAAVAVKRLRFWDRPIPMVEKAIAKEIKIWTKLSHPNVLPILGYVLNWTGSLYPSLVSPWMENGTLRDYIKRADVDTHVITVGIASGIQYLHSQQVVHADLKCDNVLLSPTLQPLLTDFGLSRQVIASVSTSTSASGGTLRWKAPELLRDGAGKANEKSDIWAFGMTILELLTKDVPYSGLSDVQVVRSLVDGNLPAPPDDIAQYSLTDQYLWSLCQDCWIIDSSKRPSATEVQRKAEQVPPESITQLTQIPSLYPYLNLTDIVPSDGHGLYSLRIPYSDFLAYLQNRQNIALQNLWDELNFEPAPEAQSGFIKVEVRRLWPRSSQPDPSVIAKEIATLAELSHPNVLPSVGYIFGSDEQFSSVFPHIELHMRLDLYMAGNDISILPMAEGIASGLAYLHSNDVVCSILKCINVRLSPSLQPLIKPYEFWLSTPDSGVPQEECQEILQDNCRWMAMEIFDDRGIGQVNKETDVWAFGMTVLELITKDYPYGWHTPESDVIDNLKYHRLPPPPRDIDERLEGEQELFALCQECWNFDPSERPNAQEIHERIQEIMRDLPSDINVQ